MKKIILFSICIVCLSTTLMRAQSAGNSMHIYSKTHKKNEKIKKQESTDLVKKNFSAFLMKNNRSDLNIAKVDSLNDFSNRDLKVFKNELITKVDSNFTYSVNALIASKTLSNDKLVDSFLSLENSYNNDIDSIDNENKSNNYCTGKIFGQGGANTNIDNISQGTANLAIGIMFRLGRGNNSWDEIYAMYNAHAANSADTSSFAKTFLFPEIGKRLFYVGYSHVSTINSALNFDPFLEFSYNKLSLSNDSQITSTFYSESITIGSRFEFHKDDITFGDTSVPAILTLEPYYNLVSVDPKYYSGENNVYDQMLKQNNLPPTFHSIGFVASLQISNFQIFADMKYVLNEKNTTVNNVTNTDLKGPSIIIGTVISSDILNF